MSCGKSFIGGAALLLLAAAGFTTPARAADDTIVVGLVAEPVSFDNPQVSDLNTTRMLKRIFEGLTDLKIGTYEIVPGLAESWEVSEDEKSYTFKLREGVTFHDGTPFNAEAVKYSLERQFDPDHPQHAPGVYPYAKGYLGNVDSIEVVDDHTVRINLKKSAGAVHPVSGAPLPAHPEPEVTAGVRPRGDDASGWHRSVQAYGMDAGRPCGYGTQRRLLGRRTGNRATRLRPDHRGAGAPQRHYLGRGGRDAGCASGQHRAAARGSEHQRDRGDQRRRLVRRPQHRADRPAAQQQAGPPGPQLRRQQAGHRRRHPAGNGHRGRLASLAGLRTLLSRRWCALSL